MSRVDLYTPWREPADVLQKRTVGRDELVRRLEQGVAERVAGRAPLDLFFFGPRGVGKSHLVARLNRLASLAGLRVTLVPEDVPAIRNAEELLALCRTAAAPAWLNWESATRERKSSDVLIIEGLDRRLGELGQGAGGREARQVLRAHWSAPGHPWVVGTGVELTTALTESGEPLFGAFDAVPVPLLTRDQARALLDGQASDTLRSERRWPARRDALVTLSGGSPRVLLALSETCAEPRGVREASDALLAAVDRFTPHYQHRFRDLSPQNQHIVALLAAAPREMGPSEIADRLAASATTTGTQARRLAEDGVLTRVERGGTWYSIAEPLFRYWLEYRTGEWSSTRVAMASSLMQALFSPEEIVEEWWSSTDADPVLKRAATGQAASMERLVLERRALPQATDEALVTWQRKSGLPGVIPTLDFVAAVCVRGVQTRPAFSAWLGKVESLPGTPWQALSTLMELALDRSSSPGAPWKLKASERARLAYLPFFRARFLTRGRLRGHPPLLAPEDIAAVGTAAPDLALLLVAGQSLGASSLVGLCLSSTAARRRGTPVMQMLPPNPAPGRRVPNPSALAGWIERDLRSLRTLGPALSWARSFADLETPVFESLLSAIQVVPPTEVDRDPSQARAGLIALGLVNPDRLDRVVRVLPGDWQARGIECRAMVAQLTTPSGGRLHPELEEIKRALS